MSVFRYNCVTLPLSFITQFRQDAVYDDSQTDRLYTKFDVQVQSILNAEYLAAIAPDVVGPGFTDNAALIMAAVRNVLLKPKQQLSIKFGGVELIPQPQNGQAGWVDARNGPQPQSCTVHTLTNTSFLLMFHIIAHYWERPSVGPSSVTNRTANNVISNRWSETVDIDNRNFSKRIRSGKFVIRSDNVDGVIADSVRSQMAVVGVPQGWLRESSSYTVTPDGLAIQYTVTDKEAFKMPPSPAFEADGEYIESGTYGGAYRVGECRVRLRGAKDTPQADLIRKAVSVAANKVHSVDKARVPESVVVRVNLYDNECECRIRSLVKPADVADNATWGGFDYENLSKTPFSEPGDNPPMPPYTDRGTSGFLLKAAAYYDPSLQGTKLNPQFGQLNNGMEVGQAGRAVEASCGATEVSGQSSLTTNPFQYANSLPTLIELMANPSVVVGNVNPGTDPVEAFDSTPSSTIFTDYKIRNKIEKDHHRYMAGISAPNGFQGNNAAFFQLASPTVLWIADWTASRINAKPVLPDPELTDSDWVLLDEHLESANLVLAPNGISPLYRISGTYVFGHKRSSASAAAYLVFGRPPWIKDDFDRHVGSVLYEQNLINIPGSVLGT